MNTQCPEDFIVNYTKKLILLKHFHKIEEETISRWEGKT